MPLFAILTLFPEALEPYTRESILGIAQDKGRAEILLIDFRDFARNRHRSVDDRPFGGGPGMVLRPEPIVECVEWLEARHGVFRKFALCPSGRPFRQPLAEELASEERILLLCGRYEGFDDRIRQELDLEPLSVGDYVLAGGELSPCARRSCACSPESWATSVRRRRTPSPRRAWRARSSTIRTSPGRGPIGGARCPTCCCRATTVRSSNGGGPRPANVHGTRVPNF